MQLVLLNVFCSQTFRFFSDFFGIYCIIKQYLIDIICAPTILLLRVESTKQKNKMKKKKKRKKRKIKKRNRLLFGR